MPVIVKDTMFGSGSEVEVSGETLTKAVVPTFLLQGETEMQGKVLATGTIGQNRFANVRLGAPSLACGTYVPVLWARSGS
jgi:hypothetical protein